MASNSSNTADFSSPLFLHPSDHPGMMLVSVPFTGSGFASWRRAMLIALSAKNKIGLVNGKCARPNEDSPNFMLWERCNNMVISWILNALSREIADSVIYSSDACEMWSELEQRFGLTNGTQLYNLHKELSTLTQGNLDISTYFTKAKRLWDEISSIDIMPTCTCVPICTCGATKTIAKKLQDQRLIHFLMGLNDRFNNVRGNILMMTPLPDLGYAYSLLIQEEKHKETRSITSTSVDSMSFSAGNAGGFGNVGGFVRSEKQKTSFFCSYCKRSGHTDDRCWKKHGYPQGFKGNNPNFKGNKGASKRVAASVQVQNDSKENVDENKGSVCHGEIARTVNSLSKEQYNQLLQLLSQAQMQSGERNASGGSAVNCATAPTSSNNFSGPFFEEATGNW